MHRKRVIFPMFYAAHKRQLAETEAIYKHLFKTHFARRMKRQFQMNKNAINASAIADVSSPLRSA